MAPSLRTMKLGGIALWLLGLGLLLTLVAMEGWQEVLQATAAVGPWGLLGVCLIQALPMLADSLAWRHLVRAGAPPLRVLFWIRWISEAVNNLLPVATVGGEFLRAWMAHRGARLPGPVAGAGVLVDLTLGVATQVLFTLAGLLVLLGLDGGGAAVGAALVGGALLAACLAAFFWVQRAGLFAFLGGAVARIASAGPSAGNWASLADDGHALDQEARALYRAPRRILASGTWRLLGWICGTLEVWAALWFLGHPVGLAEALMIESLVQAVRSAAFMVPGALGVQEAGLILLGGIAGLGADVSLALSLLKRVRELFWGLPGLLAWQLSAMRRQWSGGTAGSLDPQVQIKSHQA